jgi:3-methyladenine DNA glycosylase AlkD
MVTPLPRTAAAIVTRLPAVYGAAADPERAVAMAAYMRDQFPFLGIPSPVQKRLAREVMAGIDRPDERDLRSVSTICWRMSEREYQYFACGLLRRHVRGCGPGFLTVARHLVTTKPWWDTVDALAAHTVGPLVARHPELVASMDEWAVDEDMWLVRTAILHQLTFKEATDAQRLFRYCRQQAAHKDFFVRKAIGWALREYARTDPAAVRAFVHGHASRLSGLSVREATKHM